MLTLWEHLILCVLSELRLFAILLGDDWRESETMPPV